MKFIVDIPDGLTLTKEGRLLEFLQMHSGADVTVIAADKPAFVVIQEGGSSTEQYLHWFDTIEDAERDRYDCRDDGSYRTSPIVEVPAILAAAGGGYLEDTFAALMDAVGEIDYPAGPNPGYVEPEQPETPTTLAVAGYRIELGTEGRQDERELVGRYWRTWSKGSGIDSSNDDWDSDAEAIGAAYGDLAKSKEKARATVKEKKHA